jgi:hypothetical protein
MEVDEEKGSVSFKEYSGNDSLKGGVISFWQ